MNCHNGEKFLNDAIISVLNQTYKKFELIFFNNFSSDRSEDILKSFKDERIRYHNSKKYLNLYRARNEAIKVSTGDYVTFLDTDDLWESNKLEKQIEFFKLNKKAKLLYTNYNIFRQPKNKINLFLKNKKPAGDVTQDLLNSNFIGISTIMIKKTVFEKFNFDNKYSIIGDFDFYINFSLENHIDYLDLPLLHYRWHGDNLSNKRMDIYLNEFTEWYQLNKKKLNLLGFSLFNLRIFLIKLRIKLVIKKFFPGLKF